MENIEKSKANCIGINPTRFNKFIKIKWKRKEF